MHIPANSIYFSVYYGTRSDSQVSHKNKSGRIYAASLAFCIFYVRVEAAFCSAMHKILLLLVVLVVVVVVVAVLVVVVDFIDFFLNSFLQLFAMWAAAAFR